MVRSGSVKGQCYVGFGGEILEVEQVVKAGACGHKAIARNCLALIHLLWLTRQGYASDSRFNEKGGCQHYATHVVAAVDDYRDFNVAGVRTYKKHTRTQFFGIIPRYCVVDLIEDELEGTVNACANGEMYLELSQLDCTIVHQTEVGDGQLHQLIKFEIIAGDVVGADDRDAVQAWQVEHVRVNHQCILQFCFCDPGRRSAKFPFYKHFLSSKLKIIQNKKTTNKKNNPLLGYFTVAMVPGAHVVVAMGEEEGERGVNSSGNGVVMDHRETRQVLLHTHLRLVRHQLRKLVEDVTRDL